MYACRVVLVSSGAVGVGAQRLGLSSRPSKLPQKQALAAVGQVHLMRFYDDFFSALGLVGHAFSMCPAVSSHHLLLFHLCTTIACSSLDELGQRNLPCFCHQSIELLSWGIMG